jgi:hypothetical protein
MKKIRVRSGKLVARVYPILEQSVEEGVAAGLRRADKHADDPLTESQIDRVSECVRQAVLDAIMERFDVKGERL